MPFGPVNGPAIFITMMMDLDSTWNTLACDFEKINVGKDADTRIIVDDILSFMRLFEIALKYIESILKVCRSLCLRKCMWFLDVSSSLASTYASTAITLLSQNTNSSNPGLSQPLFAISPILLASPSSIVHSSHYLKFMSNACRK